MRKYINGICLDTEHSKLLYHHTETEGCPHQRLSGGCANEYLFVTKKGIYFMFIEGATCTEVGYKLYHIPKNSTSRDEWIYSIVGPLSEEQVKEWFLEVDKAFGTRYRFEEMHYPVIAGFESFFEEFKKLDYERFEEEIEEEEMEEEFKTVMKEMNEEKERCGHLRIKEGTQPPRRKTRYERSEEEIEEKFRDIMKDMNKEEFEVVKEELEEGELEVMFQIVDSGIKTMNEEELKSVMKAKNKEAFTLAMKETHEKEEKWLELQKQRSYAL